MMTLDGAVTLVLFALENGQNGDIFVQKAPAVKIRTLADAVIAVMNKHNHPILEIGTRHGEKLHEALLSREEMARAEDRGNFFRVPADNRDLNYEMFVERGDQHISLSEDYDSQHAVQLDLDQTKEMLLSLLPIRRIIQGEPAEFEFGV
jgi:UDP-glucose 4-epimerase